MAMATVSFELAAWGRSGVFERSSERLDDRSATLKINLSQHHLSGRIDVGLRKRTASGSPSLVPCAAIEVPGPPDASDPAKKSKTFTAQTDDGAGLLSVTYKRERDGEWALNYWSLKYETARSCLPAMRANCAHVGAKLAARAQPSCASRRNEAERLLGWHRENVAEERAKLRAAEEAQAAAEAEASEELSQIARDEDAYAASFAEMERAVQ